MNRLHWGIAAAVVATGAVVLKVVKDRKKGK